MDGIAVIKLWANATKAITGSGTSRPSAQVTSARRTPSAAHPLTLRMVTGQESTAEAEQSANAKPLQPVPN